jgi:hypothetical protein
MIGTVLIVTTPWIVFGLSLAAICLRLRRFRRFSRGSRKASRGPSDDDNNSPANTNEQGGNARHRTAESSSARPSSA